MIEAPESIRGIDLVRTARAYLGTPFHHQGRLRGVGIDCTGLVICAARDAGLDLEEALRTAGFAEDLFARYARDSRLESLEEMLGAIADRAADVSAGRLLVFRFPHARSPHLGIASDRQHVIHAADRVGRVVEHRMDLVWLRALKGVWRLKGITADG